MCFIPTLFKLLLLGMKDVSHSYPLQITVIENEMGF